VVLLRNLGGPVYRWSHGSKIWEGNLSHPVPMVVAPMPTTRLQMLISNQYSVARFHGAMNRIAHFHSLSSAATIKQIAESRKGRPSRNIFMLYMTQKFYATGSQTIKKIIFSATPCGALVPAWRPGRSPTRLCATGC
jgi:hypothetical protein